MVLFLNFFLIILAYYQVKAASRSLVLEYFDPDAFPWLWIVTATLLAALIGVYHRIVERHRTERPDRSSGPKPVSCAARSREPWPPCLRKTGRWWS